ncbi:MAG: adenylate kinase [Porphyromonas sp.]|nr:adenylate kinase [Porphyromonas sp.]
MLNILLFGAPGSGKGTQSKLLAEHYGLDHISTGDLLREEVAKDNELSHKIDALISVGNLVPDEWILDLLFKHIDGLEGKKGIILDGFPRTYRQAEELVKQFNLRNWPIPLLVALDVKEDELMQRLVERGKTSGRSDDNEETIKERFKIYHKQSEPVIEFFKETDSPIIEIYGQGAVDEVTHNLIRGIDGFIERHEERNN